MEAASGPLAGLSRCALLSLQDVLMQDSRLYLIFEFLSMDLKKYLDSIPPGQFMDSSLVKVKELRAGAFITTERGLHPCALWLHVSL